MVLQLMLIGQITIADAAQLDLNYDDGTPLVAVLTVEVSDGSLTDTVDVTVNLNPINDNAPSAGTTFQLISMKTLQTVQ